MFSINRINTLIKKFNSLKVVYKIASVIVILILCFAVYLGIMQHKESKRIKEYKNTKIAQELYVNNKKFEPKSPYKLRNDIVFLPFDDIAKALDVKYSYTEENFGKIVLNYQGTTYDLKKGSNIVYNRKSEEETKMDGRVELIEGKLYVPMEFIKDCMYVNILELSNNRVFIDSFKERFNYDWIDKTKYIAHAMGGIDRRAYTNSLEAFKTNYKMGYRTFEIDITFSVEEEPVLLHSWNPGSLKKLGLPSAWNENRPTKSQFEDTLVNGMYHTLSFEDACKLMQKYKDITFVLDAKAEGERCKRIYQKCVKTAKSIDPKLLDRMIPQIYEEDMLNDVMDVYDFKSIIYSLYKQDELNSKEIIDFAYENGVKAVVVDRSKLNSKFINELKQRGVYVYVNTYNDTEKVKELEKLGAKGIFSDFINPKTEENRYEIEAEEEEASN